MSIRSALNRQRLLRDFSCLPGSRPVRTRTARLLGSIKERIPFKDMGLTSIRNLNPLSVLRRPSWAMGKGKRAPKRCIGIDIGRLHVHAVQVARTPDGTQVEKGIGIQTRRSTDSLVRVLRSLTHEHGFDPHAEIAVSLPHQTFYFADVQTDPAGVEAIRAGDTTRLKDCFPIPAEDVIAGICSVLSDKAGAGSLLVVAASCESLREQLNVLGQAGIEPAWVDTPTTAARATVLANHARAARGLAVMVYVDESTLSMTVMRDGSILLVRNLPMFSGENQDARALAQQTADVVAEEIEITWRRLFGKAPDAGLPLFLIASRRMAQSLASAITGKIDCEVVAIDPFAGVTKADAIEADFSLCVAEGLARRGLQGPTADNVDFLAAYRARTRPAVQPRRELAICGGLAAAAAAVWIIGLFVRLSALESQYANLKEQEVAIFQRVAPGESSVVNPAAQLQQKLDALRKECELFTCFNPGRPAPLEILSMLSRQMPARGSLKLHDVLIAADSVRITGSCDSFKTFFDWQQLLEKTPGLRLVDAPQPQKDPRSQKIQFTVSLSTTEKRAS